MLRIRPTWVVLTCTLFLNATPVSIFNDLSNSQDNWGDVTDDAPLAASFSTGGTAYNLTSVVVMLSNNGETIVVTPSKRSQSSRSRHSAAVAGKVQKAKPSKVRPAIVERYVVVSLYSDSSTSPGTLLATSATTVADTSLSETPAAFTFPFSNYPLANNTRYWIGVSSPNDSVAEWWVTNTLTGTETATEYSEFDGEVLPNDQAFLMQVIVDPSTPPPTPAPASVTLVVIGLGCAAWYFRRRKGLQSS
jgi:hypothetical protein